MGEVWLANHETLGQQVAVKLLAHRPEVGEFESRATAAARFRFEAHIAARLSRKTRHIVRVTDHGEADAFAYLVMELLEGSSLDERLARGAMTPAETSRLVTQVARALACAHDEGVVHRDLKPANIFLARDEGGELLVKLLDFGIARALQPQRIAQAFRTAPNAVWGTPGYMSPEQERGSSHDRQVDLWALATVAYEALTGMLPHEEAATLDVELRRFFERAFAPSIDRRFGSATELAQAFERAALAVPSPVGRAPRRTPHRRIGLARLLSVSVLFGIAAAAAMGLAPHRAAGPAVASPGPRPVEGVLGRGTASPRSAAPVTSSRDPPQGKPPRALESADAPDSTRPAASQAPPNHPFDKSAIF